MPEPADSPYSFLALGDSYTIGESLLMSENFPNQTVKMLMSDGFNFTPPEIIAKTGWTTDELQSAIDKHQFLKTFDFVTLLIGVNNQYRANSLDEYKPEFENLLKQAIQLTGGKNKHVIVFSIPDWGVTPFAKERDRNQITLEIDSFNSANKMIAETYKVNYIDITPGSREASDNPDLLAADGLHPSAKEYLRWAKKAASVISGQLK